MPTSKPTWLTQECPSWCTKEHDEDDSTEDRYHRSEPTHVAAVVADTDTVPITLSLTGLDLSVRRGRYAEDGIDWVIIEPLEHREPRLALTTESATRLAAALRLQVP